jgi:hypothetical protein
VENIFQISHLWIIICVYTVGKARECYRSLLEQLEVDKTQPSRYEQECTSGLRYFSRLNYSNVNLCALNSVQQFPTLVDH